jgi:hypothetical protein
MLKAVFACERDVQDSKLLNSSDQNTSPISVCRAHVNHHHGVGDFPSQLAFPSLPRTNLTSLLPVQSHLPQVPENHLLVPLTHDTISSSWNPLRNLSLLTVISSHFPSISPSTEAFSAAIDIAGVVPRLSLRGRLSFFPRYQGMETYLRYEVL